MQSSLLQTLLELHLFIIKWSYCVKWEYNLIENANLIKIPVDVGFTAVNTALNGGGFHFQEVD